MVSKTISFLIRGTEALFAVILLGLVGSIITHSNENQYTKDGSTKDNTRGGTGNVSQINMAIWCALFSLVSNFWLVGVVSYLAHRQPENQDRWTAYTLTWLLCVLLPEGLNIIFYFSDAIALADGLGVHSCANPTYTTQNGITKGTGDTGRRCREAQAVTVFMFFALLAWILSAILSIEAIIPWEDWPSVAWLVPWRGNSRDTDPRDPDANTGEPPLAAFPEPRRGRWTTSRGDWQETGLEQPPQAASLESRGSRSSRKKQELDGGPAVTANRDVAAW